MNTFQKRSPEKSVTILKMVLILSSIFFYGCLKFKPVAADFTIEKTTYIAGETVKATNTSINAQSYKWTLPNGEIRTTKDIEYVLPEDLDNGGLTFKLEAFGKKVKDTHQASGGIYVYAAMGNAVFWKASSCGCGIVNVTIGDETVQINTNFTSAPGCDDPNAALFTLKVGTYPYTATDGTKSWNGNITITKDGCTKIQLT